MHNDYKAPHPVALTAVFHSTFGRPVRTAPTIPSAEDRLLRAKLVLEEAAEFAAASGFPVEVFSRRGKGNTVLVPLQDLAPEASDPDYLNLVEVADGLADLNVVVNGTALVWGLPIAALDQEVHASNMSKLGEDGAPVLRADGKVLKGPNYHKPDILHVLGLKAEQVRSLEVAAILADDDVYIAVDPATEEPPTTT